VGEDERDEEELAEEEMATLFDEKTLLVAMTAQEGKKAPITPAKIRSFVFIRLQEYLCPYKL
jgi:hypothetical protein